MSKNGKKITTRISLNFKPELTLGELHNMMVKNETDNPMECTELKEKLDSIEIKSIKIHEED